MTTATDQLKRDDAERQQQMFMYMVESFVKRWAPEDKYAAAEFHAEFHSLVRQIYRDAQEPVLKHLTELCGSMLTLPIRPRA